MRSDDLKLLVLRPVFRSWSFTLPRKVILPGQAPKKNLNITPSLTTTARNKPRSNQCNG